MGGKAFASAKSSQAAAWRHRVLFAAVELWRDVFRTIGRCMPMEVFNSARVKGICREHPGVAPHVQAHVSNDVLANVGTYTRQLKTLLDGEYRMLTGHMNPQQKMLGSDWGRSARGNMILFNADQRQDQPMPKQGHSSTPWIS